VISLFFRFPEPSAAEDFRGERMPMADKTLQRTAKTAGAAVRPPMLRIV
jgi:hypothetical protein